MGMTTSTPLPTNPSATDSALPTIQVLPPHIVNRIAAGEVVERPASVVKELVENALDAGATRIAITASNGGRTLRIADNGHGMTPDNATRAFLNHATSKILTDDDLSRIETFGFRGEALASIAAVSQFTCLTKTSTADTGTKVVLTETGEPHCTPTGCATGTIMALADLFGNVPARLKFLKKPATELAHIEDTTQRLALAHPSVQFSLTLNEREALKTDGLGELSATFSQTYRVKNVGQDFLSVGFTDDDHAVSGLISTPVVMKNSRKHMLTYVNGRAIQCNVMRKAIEAAYESLLPHGKYPFTVIFLTLPATEVDVNVHPTKKEVRYAQPNRIFGLIKHAVRKTLQAANITPMLAASAMGHSHGPSFNSASALPSSHLGGQGNASFSTSFHAQPTTQQLSSLALGAHQPLAIDSNEIPFESATQPERTEELSPQQMAARVKVIGQLFNTYILLETPQGLMVVDQHIASERTLFEQFKRQEDAQAVDTQPLLASETIPISPLQRELLAQQREKLSRLGFEFSLTDSAVQLTGVPLVYLEKHNPVEWFQQALNALEDDGDINGVDIENLLATMSCHRAVRAGDTLSQDEMQAVITQWLGCTLPWTCPHGRPIAHTIKADDLNKFFHRPSLPVNAGV